MGSGINGVGEFSSGLMSGLDNARRRNMQQQQFAMQQQNYFDQRNRMEMADQQKHKLGAGYGRFLEGLAEPEAPGRPSPESAAQGSTGPAVPQDNQSKPMDLRQVIRMAKKAAGSDDPELIGQIVDKFLPVLKLDDQDKWQTARAQQQVENEQGRMDRAGMAERGRMDRSRENEAGRNQRFQQREARENQRFGTTPQPQPYQAPPSYFSTSPKQNVQRYTPQAQPSSQQGGGGDVPAGATINGYKFKGGDPNSRDSWEQVE
jgi:hypothetical protein